MISIETGVYLQFFDEHEPPEKELPPLGPFELLIIRHNRIVGDREEVDHDLMGVGAVERWLEAELELRRALGDEPGGMRRSHMRIRAPRGDIIVRFYDYAGDEAPKVPELGPFYMITVAKREVRADDKLLAIRSTDLSPWTLTDQVRPGIAGINKADFSVFSLSARGARPTPQGPVLAPLPPQLVAATSAAPAASTAAPITQAADGSGTVFVERRKVAREIYSARPPSPQSEAALTPADVNLILRVDRLKQQELAQELMVERLRREQHIDPEVALRQEAIDSLPMRFQPPVKERVAAAPVEDPDGDYIDESLRDRALAFLWSARLFIITGLILIAGIAAFGYVRGTSAVAGPRPLTYAAAGDKINAGTFVISVDSVERTRGLGVTPPTQGSYLLVHITATRKDADAPALEPSDFLLLDPSGAQAGALAASSDLYSAATGLTWVTRYPPSAPVREVVVFDVSPGGRDLTLLIRRANVQVRLPDTP